jgi:hypothetical protein
VTLRALFDPPVIDCPRLAAFDAASLTAVRRVLSNAHAVPMRQAWRAEPEPSLAPAAVRAGWRDDVLCVFAELADADIHTAVTDHNQRSWELGDVFEMFLQPVGQLSYVELQVAPNNCRLQLKFPDAEWRGRVSKEDAVSQALRPTDTFTSTTWLDAALGQWCVLAMIPAATVADRPGPLAGSHWRFSFSRYDYTRGANAPVISSTSPHAEPGFHRLHEWGILRFQS